MEALGYEGMQAEIDLNLMMKKCDNAEYTNLDQVISDMDTVYRDISALPLRQDPQNLLMRVCSLFFLGVVENIC